MTSFGVKPHNRIEPSEDAAAAHLSGESVLAIATRLGVSRAVIVRWLRAAGVEPRTRKEAGALRVVLTDEQRIENRRAVTRNYRASKRGEDLPDHIAHGSPAAIAVYACACPECKAAKREYDRKRRAEKADLLRDQSRRYRLENLERLREAGRRNYAENSEAIKERVREYQQTDRGRLVKRATDDRRRGVPLTPLGREYAAIVLTDPCSYCGNVGGTVDHIVAVAEGGDGDWTNLTGACARCNSKKRALSPLHFWLRVSQETSMTASH